MNRIGLLPKGRQLASDHDRMTHRRNMDLWRHQDSFEEPAQMLPADPEDTPEDQGDVPEEDAELNRLIATYPPVEELSASAQMDQRIRFFQALHADDPYSFDDEAEE